MAIEGAFVQEGSYSEEAARRAWFAPALKRGGSIGSIVGGLVNTGDLLLSAAATELKVNITAGECYVPGSSVGSQGAYYLRNTTTAVLGPFSAANGTNPRIESIYAVVIDKFYGQASNTFELKVVEGTATSGATLLNLLGVGSAPTSSLLLGYALVPANATSLVSANIKNVASVAQPGLQRYEEGTAGTRPTAGVAGRIYFATDTKHYSVDKGSGWEELFSVGAIGSYGAVTARALATEYEPSASRPTFVILEVSWAAANPRIPVSFICPAAQKWKVEEAVSEVATVTVGGVAINLSSAPSGKIHQVFSSYLTL